MNSVTILIIDDEAEVRWPLKTAFEQAGYRVLEASTGAEALARCQEEAVDLALLDYRLPDTDGLALLAQLKDLHRDVVVIMMTAYSSVERAVAAMKQGAFHYAQKPIDLDEATILVEKALETTRLRREVRAFRASQSAPYTFDRIIGDSPVMREVKEVLKKVAGSPASTLLLFGESGTGKDLAAKATHFNSARADRPFMNITCSALPEMLLESELFGHERGAFTDAKQTKKGLLELADHGTVFLDEFSEMPPMLQAKLLRFLEEKTFKRVGGNVDIRVDVRVIAATNRNLEEAVQRGQVRKDLYYRLMVLPIRMPPLRERIGDVPQLAKHFVDVFNQEFGKRVKGLDDEGGGVLESHVWEGNVRELKNVVERAMLFVEGELLTSRDFSVLSPAATLTSSDPFLLPPKGVDLEQLERSLVAQALARAKGNRTRAAALLGLSRDQIRYRLEKFGLE
jgi:two-component system, NtrC family, response regulator AtoC